MNYNVNGDIIHAEEEIPMDGDFVADEYYQEEEDDDEYEDIYAQLYA